MEASQAELYKNKGNTEFKQCNYMGAVTNYTEALKIQPHEAIYTNRAASYIQLYNYDKAIEDCQEALKLNPDFGKAYKRLFKCYLTVGELNSALESIKQCIKLEPADDTHKKDLKQAEEVLNKERVVNRHLESQDYATVCNYLTQILVDCPASLSHTILKLECLLRAANVKEALAFTETLLRNQHLNNNSKIIEWRGRALLYSGNEEKAQKFLIEALKSDHDNSECQKIYQNIKKQTSMKEAATTYFKEGDLDKAIQGFQECLQIDQLNMAYNAIVYFNLAICYSKKGNNEESLSCLNKCLYMKNDYSKAYAKRGEINQILMNYEQALQDYQQAFEFDQTIPDIKNKIKEAKAQAKKAAFKDYFKILDVTIKSDEKEIKKQYRTLALKWHPDRNSQTEDQRAKAANMMALINEAHDTLTNAEKREEYLEEYNEKMGKNKKSGKPKKQEKEEERSEGSSSEDEKAKQRKKKGASKKKHQESSSEEESSDSEEESKTSKKKKKASPSKQKSKKKVVESSSEEESSEEEVKPKKKPAKKKAVVESSDSDEDYYVRPKKGKKKKNEIFGGFFPGGLFSVPQYGK